MSDVLGMPDRRRASPTIQPGPPSRREDTARSTPRRGGPRLALTGLAAVIVTLAAVGVWSTQLTHRAAHRSVHATRMLDAYAQARLAVANEESLVRKYRLGPTAATRAMFAAADADLIAALRTIETIGGAGDRAFVIELLPIHGAYLAAIDRMFAAVNTHDHVQERAIDTSQADPPFAVIQRRVAGQLRRQHTVTVRSLDDLGATDRLAAIATAVAFVGGLVLLAFFTVTLTRMYRRLRRHAEENAHNATHDTLTDLPNSALFAERLNQRIQASARETAPFSVLVIDIDRFKEINDTLGHAIGDLVLHEIGQRVIGSLRSGDTVARQGGDEFAVLLPYAAAEAAGEVAKRVLTALREPFAAADFTVTVDASIGIVTYPTHGADAEDLGHRADVAMYLAKERRLGSAFYEPEADVNSPQRLALVGELRSAIEAGALEVHYQPKYACADLQVAGVEALVRWPHPTRGLVGPDEFIALAERTGLIKPLTMLVLRKAARQCRAWNETGLDLTVAINLSALNLADIELVADIERVLREEDLPAERLALELTESTVMIDTKRSIDRLGRLAATGIRVSIDDFGTGHSSLSYLRRLPVRELKIDRSFVGNLATDEDNAAIVHSTIDLAHNLGLSVVAEGVEDAESLAILRRLGCDHVQGFHLCRPGPAEGLLGELRQHAGAQVGAPVA